MGRNRKTGKRQLPYVIDNFEHDNDVMFMLTSPINGTSNGPRSKSGMSRTVFPSH